MKKEIFKHLFKGVSGLIWVMPGIAYFREDIYPANISKLLAVTIIEITGALIILLALVNKDTIKGMNKKVFNRQIFILAGIAAIIGTAFSFISSVRISSTSNNEKVLLPFKSQGRLSNYIAIAEKNNQEVADRYGRDEVIRVIEASSKVGFFWTELVYFFALILLVDLLIGLFIGLGVRLEKT